MTDLGLTPWPGPAFRKHQWIQEWWKTWGIVWLFHVVPKSFFCEKSAICCVDLLLVIFCLKLTQPFRLFLATRVRWVLARQRVSSNRSTYDDYLMIHRVVDPFACHEARVDNLHSQEKYAILDRRPRCFWCGRPFEFVHLLRPSFDAKDTHFDSVSDLCVPKFATQGKTPRCTTWRVSTIWTPTTVPSDPSGQQHRVRLSHCVFPPRLGRARRRGTRRWERTNLRQDVLEMFQPQKSRDLMGFGGLLAGGLLMVLFSVILHGIMCMKFGGIK